MPGVRYAKIKFAEPLLGIGLVDAPLFVVDAPVVLSVTVNPGVLTVAAPLLYAVAPVFAVGRGLIPPQQLLFRLSAEKGTAPFAATVAPAALIEKTFWLDASLPM